MPKVVWIGFALVAATLAACQQDGDDLVTEAQDLAGPPGTMKDILIGERGVNWSWNDHGTPLPDSWKRTNHEFPPNNNFTTQLNQAPLGYGESYVETQVSYGPNPNNKYMTTYFRHTFGLSVDEIEELRALQLHVMYDDGFVAYLDGQEILRRAMPSGTIAFSTAASGHEAENRYEEIDITDAIDLLDLTNNIHTLAIEVHQQSPSSSDLVFDASLVSWTTDRWSPGGNGEELEGSDHWFYWDQGGSPGAGWNQPNKTLDDLDGWSLAQGPLGFGESYLQTDLAAGHVAYYFRAELDVDHPDALQRMTVSMLYDDGFVLYVNGHEALRRSMPSGTVTPSTLASGHEAGAHETFDITAAAAPYLFLGDNTIAVEVHQASASSSDLVFQLFLDADYRVDEDVIPQGEMWEYYDEGEPFDSEFEWRLGAQHEDQSWPRAPGPLGYGETYHATTLSYGGDPANKHITTYFRNGFSVDFEPDDGQTVTSLVASVMYDDGFVAYLNGVEIARVSMPSGTITHDTLAFGHETGPHYETFDWTEHADLVGRDNILAIEVHQVTRDSSDLTFDLALHAEAE
jgi:hypothetical protein